MTPEPEYWEIGSLFHLADFEPRGAPEEVPWANGLLTGCGRDALRLVAKLARHRRWWIPSYFCQEVVRSVLDEGIELLIYPDSPLDGKLDLSKIEERPGDAVLVINYFGLRGAHDILIPQGFASEIIEDHTHAPTSVWARTSKADFCFSSLRKLYPLADGGALWSPTGQRLPAMPRLTSELKMGAFEKLTGMLLKRLYLQGHPITKQGFRPILESGEQKLMGAEISAMTPLSRATLASFPLKHWDELQRRNFSALVQQTPPHPGFRILQPSSNDNVPFSAFCVFEEKKDCARTHASLVANRVYPSRLWPMKEALLDGIPEEHARLSERSFSIPVDMRYDTADIVRVAARLVEALRA